MAADFDSIERAAHRLLVALRVTAAGDIDKMPSALRYGGLSAQAAVDAEARRNLASGPLVGDGLLRQAIEGVKDLRRWAEAARDRELRAKAGQSQSQDRNEGDVALNGYLASIIVDTWVAIWGFDIKDNERMLSFMQGAAEIVGVDPGGGARRRLRSIFASVFEERRAPNQPNLSFGLAVFANGRR